MTFIGPALAVIFGILMNGCEQYGPGVVDPSPDSSRQLERNRMVDEQIVAGGIRDAKVIEPCPHDIAFYDDLFTSVYARLYASTAPISHALYERVITPGGAT